MPEAVTLQNARRDLPTRSIVVSEDLEFGVGDVKRELTRPQAGTKKDGFVVRDL